ncbi:MAG: erythromycin esterase family protein, partial [Halobacteriales archaeon]|nr:erythromycin esterase family protein [Halobacteriales archaeon]
MADRRFADRRDAGQRLARALAHLQGDVLVLALPRGGVPVAAEVARALGAELDVTVARKLGAPGHPEFGFGAIAPGVQVLDAESVAALGLTAAQVAQVEGRERKELQRRTERFRGTRLPPCVAGRTVVVVDDGVATGVTAKAALRSVRKERPARLVYASPVGSRQAVAALTAEADEVVVLEQPADFRAVGLWYRDFAQTEDDEVMRLLQAPSASRTEERFAAGEGDDEISATLVLPQAARGLVVFAHGSGSSRSSPRNVAVADSLAGRGLASLLVDLLTPAEARADESTRQRRFDVPLLARRLQAAIVWARNDPRLAGLPVGIFGASTGAAAALVAAARDASVRAVVSRGGRPDLAGMDLSRVRAATLLIVGSRDTEVRGMNEAAKSRMSAYVRLDVVPGAMDEVARLAGDWLLRHASAPPSRPPRPARATPQPRPLDDDGLDRLLERIGDARVVMLGEATHGTHEFYEWRARITMRLVREKGFRFVGVEGDWPDCFRVNRWVKGEASGPARGVLAEFQRWPTWMWANEEVASLMEDLRAHNRGTPDKVGFYGLDVYSLHESLQALLAYLRRTDPQAHEAALRAVECFEPYGAEPSRYALAAGIVPKGCTDEVVELLAATRRLAHRLDGAAEAGLDAVLNAKVVAGAERYYRSMLEGAGASWNVRDRHMMDVLA